MPGAWRSLPLAARLFLPVRHDRTPSRATSWHPVSRRGLRVLCPVRNRRNFSCHPGGSQEGEQAQSQLSAESSGHQSRSVGSASSGRSHSSRRRSAYQELSPVLPCVTSCGSRERRMRRAPPAPHVGGGVWDGDSAVWRRAHSRSAVSALAFRVPALEPSAAPLPEGRLGGAPTPPLRPARATLPCP